MLSLTEISRSIWDYYQQKTKNIKSNDYYRVTIFLSYVDHFLSQLNERFTNHTNIFGDL